MNFFDLFDLTISFDIDQDELTARYYHLSKKYHPDLYTLKSVEEQSEALQKSSDINKGYKILKDDMSRLRHILELRDVTFEEGKEMVSQDFLMEMMDFNEALMEYKFDPQENIRTRLLKDLHSIEKKLKLNISPIISNFSCDKLTPQNLLELKSYYLKSKYLRRIKDNLKHA